MKYATLIYFTEPIRINFRVDMRQDAFLGWCEWRFPGGAEALDNKIVHGKELSGEIDDEEILIGNRQAMYFGTIPHAGEKTNVTAVCLDPVMRPPFEDILMMVFEEFEMARSALCDAVSEPEYRRLLPELAQLCDTKSADNDHEPLDASGHLLSSSRTRRESASERDTQLPLWDEDASLSSFSCTNIGEQLRMNLNPVEYYELMKERGRVASLITPHTFNPPATLIGLDAKHVETVYREQLTVRDFLQAIEQVLNLHELYFRLEKGETFYKYWLIDQEKRPAAFIGIFDVDTGMDRHTLPNCLRLGLSQGLPEDERVIQFWLGLVRSVIRQVDQKLITRAARLVEELDTPSASEATDGNASDVDMGQRESTGSREPNTPMNQSTKVPTVPSRLADLQKWKRTWKLIKGPYHGGTSLKALSNRTGVSYRIDTLRKIVAAGEEGMLD